MTLLFEGIRIIDITHVLAGPFAAYQLAVLGADVIKVEDPNDPVTWHWQRSGAEPHGHGDRLSDPGFEQARDHAQSEDRSRAKDLKRLVAGAGNATLKIIGRERSRRSA